LSRNCRGGETNSTGFEPNTTGAVDLESLGDSRVRGFSLLATIAAWPVPSFRAGLKDDQS